MTRCAVSMNLFATSDHFSKLHVGLIVNIIDIKLSIKVVSNYFSEKKVVSSSFITRVLVNKLMVVRLQFRTRVIGPLILCSSN